MTPAPLPQPAPAPAHPPLPAPAPAHPPLPAPLAAALADELVRAAQLLGDLAYDLAADPETLRRHMASLQQVDHVTQIQLAVATLLRDGQTAIPNITLEDMAQRLAYLA